MRHYNMLLTDKQQKYISSKSSKIDEHGYFTGEEILPSEQRRMMEQGKFTYSPLGKAFKRQTRTIEDQGKKLKL